jgi:GDP-mannose 6-dehydrogenase
LGYVGTVSAGCLANEGHHVVGVDPERRKVELINSGQSPIIESEIGEILSSTAKAGRLRATDDLGAAVRETDVSLSVSERPARPTATLTCVSFGEFVRRSAMLSRRKLLGIWS